MQILLRRGARLVGEYHPINKRQRVQTVSAGPRSKETPAPWCQAELFTWLATTGAAAIAASNATTFTATYKLPERMDKLEVQQSARMDKLKVQQSARMDKLEAQQSAQMDNLKVQQSARMDKLELALSARMGKMELQQSTLQRSFDRQENMLGTLIAEIQADRRELADFGGQLRRLPMPANAAGPS